jgi:7,8-dihydropterin-6-yl-methyl-4-(beta-D-ribofuranosyl)aminobenzene 5'-phosphate synthase
MNKRRVVVLCDNETSRPSIGCEWGLSLAIDLGPGDDGGLWLWDTGKTDLFLRNAVALGIDVASARGLALSHGHYDHTGGLNALLAAGFRGSIHAHPACAQARYGADPGGPKPLGPPNPLPPFQAAQDVTRLAPGLTLLTNIPRQAGRFQAVERFSLDPQGNTPDTVPDDAFLLLESQSGPVVVLGCCHSGLANSLNALRGRLGIGQVFAVLGGLHLFEAGSAPLEETAQALEEFQVAHLICGHCTGPSRTDALRQRMTSRNVTALASGQIWEF